MVDNFELSLIFVHVNTHIHTFFIIILYKLVTKPITNMPVKFDLIDGRAAFSVIYSVHIADWWIHFGYT